ncbi:MAG: hypothetical protein AB3A66_06670 [Nodularia sp. CChRGM 3473]
MPIELQQFRKQLIYEATEPFASITTDLDDLATLSRLSELRKNKYGKIAFCYFLGAVTLGVLTFIISGSGIASAWIGVVISLLNLGFIGLIIAWIYALIIRYKFSRLNIINYRYEVTEKILKMLARDIDKMTLVYMKLSFQKNEINEHKVDTIPHPYKAGWKIDIYQNQWLNIQGKFLDRTHFALTVTGLSKRQYGWKRSSSGKSKHKSKVKFEGLDVNLSLIYPQRRYGAVKVLKNEVSAAIKLPSLAAVRSLKVTDKAIHLTVRIEPNVAESQEKIYQTIVAMFLSLYQVLNLAKMLSKEKV